MNKTKLGKNIEASIMSLSIRDPISKEYKGYSMLNFVVLKKMKYLNLLCKLRYKERGKWQDLDDLNIRIPLPAYLQMANHIKKNHHISYQTIKNRKWRFITNEDKKQQE
jgi:hypothetical protein